MENSNRSVTKPLWEELTFAQQKRYYRQAEYVIDKGLSDQDIDMIAKKIYENTNT